MSNINILIIDGDMSRGGGTERMTQILSTSLSEYKNYSVLVVSLNPCNKCYFELNNKVKFIALNKSNLPILGYIWQLNKICKKYSIDIIINVDVFLSIYTIPLKILSRKLKIISWEMFNLENDLGITWSYQLRTFSLRWSDYYVCLTKRDLAAFKKSFDIIKPITYIYNPIKQAPTTFNYNIESKNIITAGNFYHTKGFDLAAEVAKIVLNEHKDWKWYFYGDGPDLNYIRKLVSNYNLEDQVILSGRKQNISEIYKDASIYVMTSRLEGFGLVLLEAKYNNIPTISFNCPSGPAEIIEDGISGFLIPPYDTKVMADKINQLISNPNERMEFAKNAKNNLDQFSMSVFQSKWTSIINELSDQ